MTVLSDPEYACAVATCKAVTAEGWWHGATDATLPGLVEDSWFHATSQSKQSFSC